MTFPQQPQHSNPDPAAKPPAPIGSGTPPPYPAGPPRFGYATPPAQGMPAPGYPHPAIVPPPTAPSGQPLAEFGDRLLARLLDGVIVGVASLVLMVPLFLWISVAIVDSVESTSPNGLALALNIIGIYLGVLLLSLLMSYIYEVEMVFRTGQTIGKRVMKLQIVPVGNETMDRGMVARRWLAAQLGGVLIPGFAWVDGLWQLWDQPWKQCLHDKFAKTVVVRHDPVKGLA